MNNDIKVTFRHDNAGATTVASPGIGQLFFAYRPRRTFKDRKPESEEFTFIFDCKEFAKLTGDEKTFKEFCKWVAPAAATIVKARKGSYEAAKAEMAEKTKKAVELLKALGINAYAAYGDSNGTLTLNVNNVLAALTKEGV